MAYADWHVYTPKTKHWPARSTVVHRFRNNGRGKVVTTLIVVGGDAGRCLVQWPDTKKPQWCNSKELLWLGWV